MNDVMKNILCGFAIVLASGMSSMAQDEPSYDETLRFLQGKLNVSDKYRKQYVFSHQHCYG